MLKCYSGASIPCIDKVVSKARLRAYLINQTLYVSEISITLYVMKTTASGLGHTD